MIHGIGTDIVEIERFARAVGRRGEKFLERLFTGAELAAVLGRYGRDEPMMASLAARFAAKEAVVKAMGGRAAGFSWHDIEVMANDAGAPGIVLGGATAARARELGIRRILVSLSHCDDYATAYTLAEGNF